MQTCIPHLSHGSLVYACWKQPRLLPAVEIKPILTVASAGAVAAAMEMESTS